MINYFRNKISPEIRQEIDNFINEKKYDLKEEVSVKSDYYLNTNHEYEVKCQILENGSHLIDMKCMEKIFRYRCLPDLRKS